MGRYVQILSACLPFCQRISRSRQAGRTHKGIVEDTEFSSLKISLEISERDERRGLTSIQNPWKSHKASSSIRETQHVNSVLLCMYWFFEQPNLKGNHAWIEWWAFKCDHVLHWFFLPKPDFLELIWIFSDRNHLKVNISHIPNPNLTD
jgi:hypothetical protein